MKRLVETKGEGFEAYLGEKVTLFGLVYIYTGTLSGVNGAEVELTDAKIVYETGELNSGDWGDAQSLPSPWSVRTAAIESWGPAKC
jgi:hypothetical protein